LSSSSFFFEREKLRKISDSVLKKEEKISNKKIINGKDQNQKKKLFSLKKNVQIFFFPNKIHEFCHFLLPNELFFF